MSEPLIISILSIGGLCVTALAALKGWQDWLALKNRELDLEAGAKQQGYKNSPALARIELADLRERVRKLEAIAEGIDL